jgi:hypothetical protein
MAVALLVRSIVTSAGSGSRCDRPRTSEVDRSQGGRTVDYGKRHTLSEMREDQQALGALPRGREDSLSTYVMNTLAAVVVDTSADERAVLAEGPVGVARLQQHGVPRATWRALAYDDGFLLIEDVKRGDR